MNDGCNDGEYVGVVDGCGVGLPSINVGLSVGRTVGAHVGLEVGSGVSLPGGL